MQISGISTTPAMFYPKKTPAPTAKPAEDQAELQVSAESFSNLVKTAAAMPEVRDDVVSSFQARIAAGTYPTPDVIDGLATVLGPSLLAQANS